MIRHSLPQTALDVIEAYWRIQIPKDGHIRCPYFRNPVNGRDKWGLTVYSGKGTPEEVESELKIIEKLEGKDFSGMQESEIRDIMEKRKLGIECSGFITRVLDAWIREARKKPIYSFIKFNTRGLGRVFSALRPYTHISVQTLVHEDNAREIENFKELVPGDIMRFNSEIDHAILITATERDKEGRLKRAEYAHSVLEKTSGGVKKGTIEFVNNKEDLVSQKWSEEPGIGEAVIYRGEPSIYRLYILKNFLASRDLAKREKY